MPRRGENIYKRKDGRWEGRYIKSRSATGKAVYGYVYAQTYKEVKEKLANRLLAQIDPMTEAQNHTECFQARSTKPYRMLSSHNNGMV